MNLAECDYHLPTELIAQHPAERRDASRLLVMERGSGRLRDERFAALGDCLRPGDLLVLNDTRVVPARLRGQKPSGGAAEVFLCRPAEGEEFDQAGDWLCLVRASGRLRPGLEIVLPAGVRAELVSPENEMWRVAFRGLRNLGSFLEAHGETPLPPYIERAGEEPGDRDRYQTVYARIPGAVAAPTAGLHFTRDILAGLESRGVRTAYITLHVGWGTFAPVRVERVEEHRVDPERFTIPPETAALVNETKRDGGRVVAVGTTVTRTLEYAARRPGGVDAARGEADLYIYPPFEFRLVDALVTNFHLPRSSLLLLVMAFAGREPILNAYEHAVRAGYRFYSYGDCMLIA